MVDAGLTILLIEDDWDSHEGLPALLESEGHVVLSAYDGEEAIRVLAGGAYPHVIVLDLSLPKRDGFEVYADLRAHPHWRQIPIFVYSALAGEARERLAGGLSSDRTFQKPNDLGSLVKALAAMAKRPSAR